MLRRWWWVFAALVTIPVLAGALVFWRASRAKEEAAAEIAGVAEYRFQAAPADRAVPAGVDPVAASPAYRDIAVFHDTIVVSARAGLFVYGRDGTLIHAYRTGLELPPAEPGAMAAGAGQSELFITTRGEGLLSFDGAGFRQILPADPALRTFTAALALGSGRLLLGTERLGVVVFDGRSIKPFHAGLKAAHITALAGSEGDLWIGTLQNGLFHHRAGQLDDLSGALPDPQVLSLAVDHGTAYAGTPLGVVEFREGQRFRTLADGYFAQSLAVHRDTLQVGTQDEGVVTVPLGARAAAATGGGPPSVTRLASLEGELYALSERAIYHLDPARGSWQPVPAAGGGLLADRNVASVAVSGGRLWVGYFDRGLDIVQMDLSRAEHHEDDTLFCINRVVADPTHERTAVATANGLVLFDAGGQPRQAMGRKDGFLSDQVTDVAFREGGMVVATPAGLSFVDRSGVRSLYAFHGLVNNHVYTVASLGKETIAGTLGGVSVLNEDTIRANYTTANSHLGHNWITALARVGDEWFAGTYGGGVMRRDAGGEWHGFSDFKEGVVVNSNAMLVTGGRVYAGSLDRGLFVFDRASGRWTNTTVGLASRNVTALAAYGGYLYIGTDNGLVRISEGAVR